MKNDWGGISFEEWVEKMLREGNTAIVKYMINLMPQEKREKYREIWRKIRNEKKENPPS